MTIGKKLRENIEKHLADPNRAASFLAGVLGAREQLTMELSTNLRRMAVTHARSATLPYDGSYFVAEARSLSQSRSMKYVLRRDTGYAVLSWFENLPYVVANWTHRKDMIDTCTLDHLYRARLVPAGWTLRLLQACLEHAPDERFVPNVQVHVAPPSTIALSHSSPPPTHKESDHCIYESRPILGAYSATSWPMEDLVYENEIDYSDGYWLSPSCREALEDAMFWVANKSWYAERLIPHKMGLLFVGGPGTGKSSFIRLLARRCRLHIHSFWLAGMDEGDLTRAWEKAVSSTEGKLMIVEDIDRVYDAAGNPHEGVKAPAFNALLNLIDGVQTHSGTLFAATVNDERHLPSALYEPHPDGSDKPSRPGRVDRLIRFGSPDDEGRQSIVDRVMRTSSAVDRARVVKDTVGTSAAQVTEVARQAAKAELWKSRR